MNPILDDIYAADNFLGIVSCIVANSLSASGHGGTFSAGTAEPAPEGTIITFSTAPNLGYTYFYASMASISGQVRNPNPVKENIVKQIDGLTDNPELYEDGEQPPNSLTKDDARNLILGVSPSGVLAGSDVYSYYGAIHISWETARKKVKLIVPPHGSGMRPSIYHGQMQDGRVTESDIESEATSGTLLHWLEWLPG